MNLYVLKGHTFPRVWSMTGSEINFGVLPFLICGVGVGRQRGRRNEWNWSGEHEKRRVPARQTDFHAERLNAEIKWCEMTNGTAAFPTPVPERAGRRWRLRVEVWWRGLFRSIRLRMRRSAQTSTSPSQGFVAADAKAKKATMLHVNCVCCMSLY